MKSKFNAAIVVLCAVSFSCFVAQRELSAAKPIRSTDLLLDPNAKIVGLFQGIESGMFRVVVAQKYGFRPDIHIMNQTQEKLTVHLPLAAVAVTTEGGGQGFGGGCGGGGPGKFGINSFPDKPASLSAYKGAMFTIKERQTVTVQMHAVCLEHGKSDPHPKMKYTLKPLESFTQDHVLHRLLENHDPTSTDRMTMQAAAWHVSNNLSWEELQRKSVNRAFDRPRRMFTKQQISDAKVLVAMAARDPALHD